MLGSVAQLLATSILALLRGSAARNRLSPYLVSHISASGCCSSFVPGIHQVPRLPIISATTVVRLMHSTFDLPSLVLKTGPLRQLPFSSYIALVLGNRDRRTWRGFDLDFFSVVKTSDWASLCTAHWLREENLCSVTVWVAKLRTSFWPLPCVTCFVLMRHFAPFLVSDYRGMLVSNGNKRPLDCTAMATFLQPVSYLFGWCVLDFSLLVIVLIKKYQWLSLRIHAYLNWT